jgi:hypothetical protein
MSEAVAVRADSIVEAAELGQCVEAMASEAVAARAAAWKGTARQWRSLE